MTPITFSRKELLTWPNMFTLARLVAIPVFLWLLFGRDNRAAAAWLLAALGSTDWVDGWLARKLDQGTEFGRIFDPTVDRALFLVSIPAIVIDGSMPLWVAALALGREVLVAVGALYMAARKVAPFQVTWEGKTGTFLMLIAVPMFLGGNSTLSYAGFLAVVAWLCAIPGLAYGFWAAFGQYLPQARAALR